MGGEDNGTEQTIPFGIKRPRGEVAGSTTEDFMETLATDSDDKRRCRWHTPPPVRFYDVNYAHPLPEGRQPKPPVSLRAAPQARISPRHSLSPRPSLSPRGEEHPAVEVPPVPVPVVSSVGAGPATVDSTEKMETELPKGKKSKEREGEARKDFCAEAVSLQSIDEAGNGVIANAGPLQGGDAGGGDAQGSSTTTPISAVISSAATAVPPDRGTSLSHPQRQRWRTHQMAEDFVTLAGRMMYPAIRLGPFDYDAAHGRYPIERVAALGVLTSPLRRPAVVERWSPYEIAVFESALSLYGKHFHQVQRVVRTKTTKEIVEFYYIWKKTSHYKVWKRQYEPEIPTDSEDD